MTTEDHAPQDVVPAAAAKPNMQVSIDETCCGKCLFASCYVDFLTGERS